jgi:hypothetical protein
MHGRTHDCVLITISHKWKCLIVWKERLNRCDGQQYHQYQQMNNIISPQTGCITMDGVGNQGPGLREGIPVETGMNIYGNNVV